MTRWPLARAIALLTLRTARSMARRPELVLTPIAFALVLSVVNLAALHTVDRLPHQAGQPLGFSYFLPSLTVQLVTVAATNHAVDLAEDLEGGFHARLRLSPVSRGALLAGLMAGAVLTDVLCALATVGALLLAGAAGAAGPIGFVRFALLVVGYSITANALLSAIALRTRSAATLEYLFPVFLLGLFVSSGFFDETLMSGWFRAAVRANPLTALIDGLRGELLTGFHAGGYVPLALGLAAASVTAVGVARWALAKGRPIA